jgi:phage terminase large subunit-like protein
MTLIPGYDPIATAPPGYWFDVAAAEDVIAFFAECLQHVKGKKGGQPFLLEPWQQAKTGCIFGWKTPENTRRYREVFAYEPRKQGKTPWSAGIVLYTLIRDPEAGIEAYSAASDKEQAALCYQYAHGMILQEPELKARIKVYTATKVFEYLERFAYYKVLSAVPDSKHGLNVHLGIIDETHAHPNAELIDVITTGTAARTQSLIVHTTTADWLRESVCNEKYEYACKVRDGVVQDPAFLPIIYEATPPADEETDPLWWTKEAVWRQANPNYGVSVEPDYIQRACQEALEVPRKRNVFKRLHLNIRTGQENIWFGLEAWDACADRDFDWQRLEGQACFAGLDLASVSDLCAFVLYFPDFQAVLPYFWLPQQTIAKRTAAAGVDYQTWVEQGHIRITPGNATDYDRIRMDITTRDAARTILAAQRACAPSAIPETELPAALFLGDRFQIREIPIDRWNSTQLQTQLAGDGFEVVPFGQGFASMSAPSKELERLITAKTLRQNGHPVLRWMASHVAVEEDAAGNLKPSKRKSTEKIDGIVALVMAIGRALVADPATGPSVYERRGALIL